MIIFIISFIVLLFFAPVLLNPTLFFERGNDLQQFFMPLLIFIKDSLMKYRELPLWNNTFFSGTPLLPDPQSQLFYLPNIIFLFFGVRTFFLISILIHALLGSFGAFLFFNKALKFNRFASIVGALLFVIFSKNASYLEAGHFGMFVSWMWIPYIFFSIEKILFKPKLIWAFCFAFFFSLIFYSHILIFAIILIFSILYIFLSLIFRKNIKKRSIIIFAIGSILFLGLISITISSQINWSSLTTRSLLLSNPDTYPKWSGPMEFLRDLVFPFNKNITDIWKIDSEKWIFIGIMPAVISSFTYFRLKRKSKLIIGVIIIPLFLIALNNSSFVFPLLLKQKWFLLLRVATRVLTIFNIIVIFAVTYWFNKQKTNKIIILIAVFLIIESLSLSWIRLYKPRQLNSNLKNQEIYHFLLNDKENYRIFCLNRCISQDTASINGLQLVDGYGTLIQMNYYKRFWQFTNSYWNYYTLSLPPFGTFLFEKINPDAKSLGEYNAKYIISEHKLTNKDFSFVQNYDNYFLYQNNLFLPRSYYLTDNRKNIAGSKILFFSPNKIIVSTSDKKDFKHLILSEVYSSGWKAYLNGKEEAPIQETPESLRAVDLDPTTDFVSFVYEPYGFKLGLTITILSYVLIFLAFFLFMFSNIKRTIARKKD